MDIIDPFLDMYLSQNLADKDDPILLEMEAVGIERDFPIVGPQVGRLIQLLCLIRKPKLIVELGSGYGYSTLWFARSAGKNCRVHHTDNSETNSAQAKAYLTRAGVIDQVEFHVGDALEWFAGSDLSPDILFADVDKEQYPNVYGLFKDRMQPGSLVIIDNLLWSGRVIDMADDSPSTLGVRAYTERILADRRYMTTILPVRDGVGVSIRK